MKQKPQENVRIYAAGLILKQVEELSSEIEGVRNAKDIEAVHHMRVSTRRLRAILEVFQDCLPQKRGIVWQQEVRKLTNALGEARDTDVQIDSLNEIYQKLPDPIFRPGFRRLLLRYKQRRAKLQVRLITRVNEFESSGLMNELLAAYTRLASRNMDMYLYTPDLYKRAFEKIQDSYKDFSSYEEKIMMPENITELHAMRIAGKNFRYILECFSSIYSSELKNPISAMKTAQELLGNIHDCDMWVLELPKFQQEEHQKALAYFGHDRNESRFLPGFQYLTELKQQNRDLFYKSFIEKWEKWKSENVWENLFHTLQVPFFQEKDLMPLSLIEQFRNGENQ